MSGCSGIGALAKLAVQGGAAGTRNFTNSSERYAFISEDIKPTHAWSGQQWGIGEIAPTITANRRKLTLFEGTIILEGSRANMEKWIPRALWSSSSTSPFDVGSDPTDHEFDILISRDGGTFRYLDCLVNSLTIFSNAKDQLCYMAVGIVAKQDFGATAWPSPEPALPVTATYFPYCHFESSLTINTIDIPMDRVSLSINNKLVPVAKRSLYAQKFRSQGREMRLSGISIFDGDAYPELDALLDGSADATLEYTNPSIGTVTFDFQNFQNIAHETPTIPNREAIPVPFQLRANKDNLTTPELSVTTGI